MRLALLIPTIDRIGGAERQTILLASGMAQRGRDVAIIALAGSGGNSLEELSSHGVSFTSLNMRNGLADPRGWIGLHRWMASHKPDVLHAHLPHASLLARASRLVSPIRVLIDTIHSPATGGSLRRFAFRVTSRLPNIVTAVSPSAAEPWTSGGLVHRPNLVIVPNGIDFDYWKPEHEARRSPEFRDRFVWLTVGRLDAVKDHATLLHAFACLERASHLLIAGTGSLRSELQRLSHDLGIASRVSFLGFRDDIRTLMRTADAFVLNSRWEGLPVALLEACACELPAVITNTPGAREVLPDPGVSPVPIGDSDALAAGMRELMSFSKSKRLELAVHQRQTALSFNLSSTLDSYEELYRNALSTTQAL